MAKIENQLDIVRKRLQEISRQDRTAIAAEAKVDVRTIDNVADPERQPSYATILRVYAAIKKLNPKAKVKDAEK